MPASSFTDPHTASPAGAAGEFSGEEKQQLLELARAAIATQLAGEPAPALPENPRLHQAGACFVTLESSGSLRGCIGSLNARRPLVEDVLHNARAAAFDDPRFPPLTIAELSRVEISISVLTPPEAFPVKNEADLLQSLRPGIDGLLLEDGAYRATFLPSVWEQLPTPAAFLAQLKRKAGLTAHHWSPTIRFSRYRTIEFSE
ncbi:MAG: AmmeMemoRadiSam system protein A [bacterium]|nr:AmmeMemoRadiSam system protein A [bacterium]